jgi:hypothetical protein
MDMNKASADKQVEEMDKVYDVSRRRFFQLAGGIAGAGLLLSACHKTTPPTDIYLGADDVALLNYLYVLQQVEATFYIQACNTPYYSLTQSELQLQVDVRDQEIAHREFLKSLLGNNAVPNIVTNFSMVTFADRGSFLTNAYTLEDLVITGMNGCVHLFKNTNYALEVSKMVTVEARHSAYFRDILKYNTFSDTVIDSHGLDGAASPAVVFEKAKAYVQTRFDSSRLPK